ncbi:hypothetical protein LV779_15605 [Streptomyces thinghirensis]|nr:hypothetical protein [Streptomyces thinghirensis]
MIENNETIDEFLARHADDGGGRPQGGRPGDHAALAPPRGSTRSTRRPARTTW